LGSRRKLFLSTNACTFVLHSSAFMVTMVSPLSAWAINAFSVTSFGLSV
jgi:hypothetical protein